MILAAIIAGVVVLALCGLGGWLMWRAAKASGIVEA
jgi:hypothetical protein